MSQSSTIFEVPADVSELAEACANHYPVIEYGEAHDNKETYAEILSSMTGKVVTADFEDDDDPSAGPYALTEVLKKQGCRYVAMVPPFEERSRGIRCDGRYVINLERNPVGERVFVLAWKDGDPSLEKIPMRAAGMDDEFVHRVLEFGTEDNPVPSPR